MKNLKIKIIGLLALVLGVLCMAGCAGGVIDTELTVEDDYSGIRTMNVTIDKEYFNDNFHGDLNDLDAVIGANIPLDMTYSWFTDADTDVFHFEVAFTSVDDYNNKIQAITGSDEYKSEIVLPAGVWSTGYRVSENFTSETLLTWLSDVLLAEGYVDSDDSSYIFELGTTSLTINGETTEVYNSISRDTLDYVSLRKIDMFTTVVDTSVFDRTYKFCVDISDIKSDGKDNSKDIAGYFESIIPAGAKLTTEENSYYYIFSIEMSSVTPEGLDTLDKALFASGEAVLSDYVTNDAFSIQKTLAETIDPSNYMFGEWQGIDINDYVKVPDNYGISNDPTYITNIKYYSEDSENPGFYRIGYYYATRDEVPTVTFAFAKNYVLSSMDVLTKIKSVSRVEKEISFVMAENPTDEHLELILNNLNTLISPETEGETVEKAEEVDEIEEALKENSASEIQETEETEAEEEEENALSKLFKKDEGKEIGSLITAVTRSKKDDDYRITVSLKGDPASVLKAMDNLTGISGELIVAETSKAFGLKKELAVVDTFAFWNINREPDDGFTMNYTLDMCGKKVNFCESPLASIDKDEVTITGKDVCGTAVTTSSLNFMGILVIVLIILGLCSIAMAFIKGAGNPEAKAAREARKQVKAQQKAAYQPVVQAPVIVAPQPETVTQPQPETVAQPQQEAVKPEPAAAAFCTKCGAPREEGSRFCTKCGNPF